MIELEESRDTTRFAGNSDESLILGISVLKFMRQMTSNNGSTSTKSLKIMRLFSYKLTNDSGFAPNPFFGNMSLATCKPRVRNSKGIGDWIAGFTSKTLCDDEVGEERLVFLMQVTDKIPTSEYFHHPNFQQKIPDLTRSEFIYQAGDNIYKPEGNDYVQILNRNHSTEHKQRDLTGRFVLISTNFYYFGRGAVEIPDHLRPEIPTGQSPNGSLTHNLERAESFIKFITDNSEIGVHHEPHWWPRNDLSWKTR
jgi:hypothetical protein